MEIRKHFPGCCALGVTGLLMGCGPDGQVVDPESAQLSDGAAESMEWSAPVNLGATINSANTENSPELSRDGLSLYFGSVNRPDGFGSTDIYVSRRACTDTADTRCAWGPPVNLGEKINSNRIDAGPHLSRDGHWMYLISDREGGHGNNDIWVSYRQDTHDDFAWEAPVNLGPPINTDQLEAGPNLRGSEFYFHRGPAIGNTDIYLSQMIGASFTDPVMVEAVSMAGSFEQRPSTPWDGHEMILSSDRKAGSFGLQDIWVSTRTGNGLPWSTPENLGPVINTAFQEQTPAITDDGDILLFSSNRPNGFGAFDLYMSVRVRKNQP